MKYVSQKFRNFIPLSPSTLACDFDDPLHVRTLFSTPTPYEKQNFNKISLLCFLPESKLFIDFPLYLCFRGQYVKHNFRVYHFIRNFTCKNA